MSKGVVTRIGEAGFQGLLQNMSGSKPKGANQFTRTDFASANGVDEADRSFGQQIDYLKGYDSFGDK